MTPDHSDIVISGGGIAGLAAAAAFGTAGFGVIIVDPAPPSPRPRPRAPTCAPLPSSPPVRPRLRAQAFGNGLLHTPPRSR